jgi:hypothetical protein
MDSPRISYRARDDATPEGELNALASVYRFALDSSERKKAASPDRPDDAKESKHVRATEKYTRPS